MSDNLKPPFWDDELDGEYQPGPYYLTADEYAQLSGGPAVSSSSSSFVPPALPALPAPTFPPSFAGNNNVFSIAATPLPTAAVAPAAVPVAQATVAPVAPAPATRTPRATIPVVPFGATITTGIGSVRWIKTAARNMAVPNLEAPGLACTNPACTCAKVAWPTGGVLRVASCAIVCEVCGLSRNDFGISASNLRRHVMEEHCLNSTKGQTRQPPAARLYARVAPA